MHPSLVPAAARGRAGTIRRVTSSAVLDEATSRPGGSRGDGAEWRLLEDLRLEIAKRPSRRVNTFTIAEAAELTGLTKKALRHRVDRGQIRAEKDGNIRRIARAELERVGLAVESPHDGGPTAAPSATQALQSALVTAEQRLAQSERALARERVLREQAELRLTGAVAEAERERERSRRFAGAGPIERRRLAREIEESERASQVFFRRAVIEDD